MATIHTSQSPCHNHNVDTLKVKLQEALENTGGQVWIIPEAEFITDSHVVSVDIILVGYLEGYGSDKKNFSFITTVEVKHHNADALYIKGEKVFVKYTGHDACATDQINIQKYTVAHVLSSAFTHPPYVSSLIWVDHITTSQLQTVSSPEIITADFSVEDLLNKIICEAEHTEEEMTAMAESLCKYNNKS